MQIAVGSNFCKQMINMFPIILTLTIFWYIIVGRISVNFNHIWWSELLTAADGINGMIEWCSEKIYWPNWKYPWHSTEGNDSRNGLLPTNATISSIYFQYINMHLHCEKSAQIQKVHKVVVIFRYPRDSIFPFSCLHIAWLDHSNTLISVCIGCMDMLMR